MPRSEFESTSLRVLIVDQHEVSRAAIRALLRTEGLEVVADVANRDEALAIGDATSPDVAVVDIGAGSSEGLETAKALAQLPSPPTVVLTSSGPVNVETGGHPFVAKHDICAHELRRAMHSNDQQTEESNRMSMQAYLDTITAKTGKTPEQIIDHARDVGLLEAGIKPAQIIAWLKDEYDLGRGHAMAIVATIKKQTGPQRTSDEKVAHHFAGKKATWLPAYDDLVKKVARFGSDTDVDPGKSYLSLRRAGKKFGIVQVTAGRLDIGIKLNGTEPVGRLERAGSWNSMVTHRVRVHDPKEIDQELLGWLEQAYASTNADASAVAG